MMEQKNQKTKKPKNTARKFFRFSVVSSFGFSLIEVVIALAIVLIAVSIFAVAINTVPLTKHARNQNLAYHLAAKKVEELRNTPFDSLPASGSFNDAGFTDLPQASGNLAVANYSGSAQIKRLTVTVSWSESGSSQSLVLETLMSDRGLNQP
ncbi:MAG: prepilin-type N-terminal cleavage/methylation domain-containing protein [bacterium]|nr:prepilin-type N-terminal cleavage/methylation domain-containing protein [bacterium]